MNDLNFLSCILSRKTKTEIPNFIYFFNSIINNIIKNDNITEQKNKIELICKMLLNTRDILHGAGEHDISYAMIYVLYSFFPNVAISILRSFVYPSFGPFRLFLTSISGVQSNNQFWCISNDKKCNNPKPNCSPFGSWRDMKHICLMVYEIHGKVVKHPLIGEIIGIINNQLYDDFSLNKSGSNNYCSLVAKWIPREKTKFQWLFYELVVDWAKKYHPYLIESHIFHLKKGLFLPRNIFLKKQYRKCCQIYRKIISGLNKKLDIIEIKMCSSNWKSIDMEKINIGSFIRYRKSFFDIPSSPTLTPLSVTKTVKENRNSDIVLNKRIDKIDFCLKISKTFFKFSFFNSYLSERVAKVDLRYFVSQAFQLLNITDPENIYSFLTDVYFLNQLWENKTKLCAIKMGENKNIIPIINILRTDNILQYYHAIGISCMISAHSFFKNRILVVNQQPSWINLDDCGDFVSIIKKIKEPMINGSKINILKTIDLFIQSILLTSMSPEQVEQITFVVLSSFDECFYNMLGEIKSMFIKAGLTSIYRRPFVIPKIICLNLSEKCVLLKNHLVDDRIRYVSVTDYFSENG
jgi:hypothetical protein